MFSTRTVGVIMMFAVILRCKFVLILSCFPSFDVRNVDAVVNCCDHEVSMDKRKIFSYCRFLIYSRTQL